MTINELLETVPPYARDLKLNLSSFLSQAELTEQQTWGTIVTSAVRIASVIHRLASVLEAERAAIPAATVA
jgi:lipoyl-dependent peroxiredoxin subunit D